MSQSYKIIPSDTVLRFFKVVAPCKCHEVKNCRTLNYNVMTELSEISILCSPVIKKVKVKCTACGAEKESNVEFLDITERDIDQN